MSFGYSFPIYVWIVWSLLYEHDRLYPITYPISRDEMMDNCFRRQCIVEMAHFDLLSFYGCMDADLP